MPNPTPPNQPSSGAPGRELYRDTYIALRVDDDDMVVWMVRSEISHRDIAALYLSYAEVIAALDRLGRKGRVLLVDTRAPPARNDPDFERAMARMRTRIEYDFVCIGVLFTSAVWALKLRHWVGDDGIERIAGTDVTELLTSLRSKGLAAKRGKAGPAVVR